MAWILYNLILYCIQNISKRSIFIDMPRLNFIAQTIEAEFSNFKLFIECDNIDSVFEIICNEVHKLIWLKRLLKVKLVKLNWSQK